MVSGGQGPGEEISEAECMYRWLVAKGIEASRIYKEDKSTSTEENIIFSEETLYNLLGVDAELLIDHAWGRETTLMEDIKNYKSKSKSVSFSQILPRDYTYEEARVVLNEMLFNGTRELMKRKVITNKLDVIIGYSKELIPATGGSIRMTVTTQIPSLMQPYLMRLYEQTTEKDIPIQCLAERQISSFLPRRSEQRAQE